MIRPVFPLLALFLLFGAGAPVPSAFAQSQGVLATVNDQPVTSFDVEQRVRLFQILNSSKAKGDVRKNALQSLVDDIIKIQEAKRLQIAPKDDLIDKQIERMAKGGGTTPDGLAAKLKSKGVSISSLRSYVAAQISMNRIISMKNGAKVEANQAEVDKRYNEIKKKYDQIVNDPRLKPITVYQIQEIDLPLDAMGDANDQQMVMSRAVEAQQFIKRYTGCKTARAAADGIFNVKIGKSFEADASKIPKQLKDALDRAGPGKAVGPGRNKTGLQVIGFCGKRTIKPQKPEMPPREAVENAVLNEAYDAQEEKYIAELRQKAYIDYKGASASQ